MDIKRLQGTLEKLNEFTDTGPGINRLAYTDTEQKAKYYLMELFEKEGMSIDTDAVGNIIARRESANPDLPAVAFGSHIDTVYEAGKYDGTVGVVAALEVIRSLNDESIVTEYPLEIILFACEESSRFGFSTLGSKAMAGLLKVEDIKDLKDKNNIFLQDEFSKYSLDMEKIIEARRDKEDFKSFLELHIEQGPVLENEGKQIGIVTGIAGPTRFILEISGQASHSGTTPMHYRKDAFLGGSEIALALESAANYEASNDTVATVGVCDVKPGAMNIVPGYVEMKIDIRGISSQSKEKVIKTLFKTIERVEASRNLNVSIRKIADETPIKMDGEMVKSLKEICSANNYSYRFISSGAGHDAMNMAHLCPTALIFIPSKSGLSHNPREYTSLEQIAIGARLLEKQILKSAKVLKKKETRSS